MIRGLHHVTATVGDAQADLDFYAAVLGLRLVKKTVNFDNTGVYHFYYGNATGTPGTIMTTFPYRGMGVRAGVRGAGQVNVTSFSAPVDAIDFWHERLAARGIHAQREAAFAGEPALGFADPSGLRIRIVGTAGDDRAPWETPDIAARHAIRGLHSVALHVAHPGPTREFLTAVMEAVPVGDDGPTSRLAIGGNAPGHLVEVVDAHSAGPAINGIGTVHHVAFAVSTGAEQLEMRAALVRLGCQVTEVRDREYFTSIYFREPGGILFEIATIPPGFATDEPPDALGLHLKLPPWEEGRRAEIEAALPTVRHP